MFLSNARRTLGGLTLLFVGFALSIQADTFSIFNTGANTANIGGVIIDQSYSVVISPLSTCLDSGAGCGPSSTTTNPVAAVDQTGVFPLAGNWAPDSSASSWISQFPGNYTNGTATEAAGIYVFQTSFYLPVGATNVNLAGIWDTDNEGLGILLNSTASQLTGASLAALQGAPGPFNITTTDQPFLSFPANVPSGGAFSFNSSNGIVAGTNYLDFVVWNQPQSGGNPEGLRVQYTTADFTAAATPEPGFYGILALGLAGVMFVARRQRTA